MFETTKALRAGLSAAGHPFTCGYEIQYGAGTRRINIDNVTSWCDHRTGAMVSAEEDEDSGPPAHGAHGGAGPRGDHRQRLKGKEMEDPRRIYDKLVNGEKLDDEDLRALATDADYLGERAGETCEYTLEYDREEVERREKAYKENPFGFFPQSMPQTCWTCSACGQQWRVHHRQREGGGYEIAPPPGWMKCCPNCGARISRVAMP